MPYATVPTNAGLAEIVQRGPGAAEISRTSLAALDTFVTPIPLHDVRDHLTDVPRLEPHVWRLAIDGDVHRVAVRTVGQGEREENLSNVQGSY